MISIIAAAVFLTGCGRMEGQEKAQPNIRIIQSSETPETQQSPGTLQYTEVQEASTDAAITDPSQMFSIRFADTDASSGAIYSQGPGDGYSQYVIESNITPSYFALREVAGDENGDMHPGSVLFETSKMKAGDYIYMTDAIPEVMPARMIEWKTSDGAAYTRAISESGQDGSLFLMEIQ